MAELHLSGVQKIYPNGYHAIHGIDLSVADGEFIVLVGPSGCGKSTLLRMVAGLETVSDGTIDIGGRVVNNLEPADRDIAMVFQNYALYPHMKVYDNMAYGLRNRGMAKDEIDRRVREAAGILEIEPMLDRRPNQLSGGQRQRVAMGRAIVREPSVFLFDEPLSNLDAKLRVQMRVEIKRLQRRLGITSLYVTHDQVEAMTMADRLVVMNGGRAEQIGTPIELYDRPETTFVATFIGSPSMNLLEGTVAEGGTSVALDSGASINLPDPRPDLAGRPVTLGVRPEHLTPAADGTGMTLRLDLVEALGADTLLHGHLDGDERRLVTVRLSGHFAPGQDSVQVAATDAVHLFDRETGGRI
ncbi:sn-glycerol-3-phosphate import ATP-binding protein UgpC [Thalassobaculum salexigens]|uniref:sn-glycerol-3-phosphate import ATP-binding protein UgpC n=1 Tax=Thalassobaculum salexigens TaxID=455360 RepID=UPI000429DC65|nr:sn-glycerol-3-phosphate import ATP-binding protein UgpC [Thalassobaculum salexigens]